MATVQFPAGNNGSNSILPMTRNAVYIKRSWSDPWTLQPHLRPMTLGQANGPNVTQARLLWYFGNKDETTYGGKRITRPLNLRGQFVKIEVSSANQGNRATLFIGLIQDEEIKADKNDSVYTGDQYVVAYGLEHLFDQVYLNEVWVSDDKGVRKQPFVPKLNARTRAGQDFAGNRSSSVPVGRTTYVFGAGGTWTNLQFLQYLLAEIRPYGITFNLSGTYAGLAKMKTELRLEHTTVKQILDVLIPRQRGYTYRVHWDNATPNNVVFEIQPVFNTGEAQVTEGTVTLDANPRRKALDFTGIEYSMKYRILEKGVNEHDEIVVEGKRIKLCGTFDAAIGTLVPGWESADETAYAAVNEGDAAGNDRALRHDKWKSVYQRFLIPETWNGKLFDASSVAYLQDQPFPNQTILPYEETLRVGMPNILSNGLFDSLVADANLYLKDAKCVRALPFRGQGGTSDNASEWQAPLVFARERALFDGDWLLSAAYHQLHLPYEGINRSNSDNTAPAAKVTMLDNAPGFQLEWPVPHVGGLADGPNAGGTLTAASNYTPQFWEKDIFATLNVELPQRIRIKSYRPGSSPTANNNRSITIKVPGAELWMVAPKTVYGVSDDGETLLQTGDDHTLVRDDRERLWTVAAAARAWFGAKRQAARIEIRGGLPNIIEPLDYITFLSAKQTYEHINTVVSAVQYDFGQGEAGVEKVIITTSYFEFDPAAIFHFSGIGNFQAVAREVGSLSGDVQEIREQVGKIPVRDGAGGAGSGVAGSAGSGATSHLKIVGWGAS